MSWSCRRKPTLSYPGRSLFISPKGKDWDAPSSWLYDHRFKPRRVRGVIELPLRKLAEADGAFSTGAFCRMSDAFGKVVDGAIPIAARAS